MTLKPNCLDNIGDECNNDNIVVCCWDDGFNAGLVACNVHGKYVISTYDTDEICKPTVSCHVCQPK